MKRLRSFLTGLGLVTGFLAAAPAFGQALYPEEDVWLGVNMSYWDTEEFGEDWGVGGNIWFSLGHGFQVRIDGNYYPDIGLRVGIIDIDIEILQIGIAIVYSPPEWQRHGGVRPYIGIGANYNFMDGDADQGAFVEFDDGEGVHAFVGVRYGVTVHVDMYLELRYTDYETEGPAGGGLIAIQPHIFDGWGGAVGVLFAF